MVWLWLSMSIFGLLEMGRFSFYHRTGSKAHRSNKSESSRIIIFQGWAWAPSVNGDRFPFLLSYGAALMLY